MKHITSAYVKWKRGLADKVRLTKHRLVRTLLAECLGTAILVAFGTGVAAQSKLTEGEFGTTLAVSLGYAAGMSLALFVVGSRSPGLCNPSVAFANALVGRLDFLKMLLFWLAQLIGAFLGTLVVLAIYWEKVMDYTNLHDNGILNMSSTGTIFSSTANGSTSELCSSQVIIGMMTIVGIMAILDKNNWNAPHFYVIIYSAVVEFLLFDDFTVQSTSSNNPALDLGGRLALLITGWGASAFTFKDYAFWIFLVMPFVGTLCGVLLYELVIGIHLPGAGEDSKNFEDNFKEEE
ncbi:unnamed protein product [Mesocestoides corti]|uniref:Aquaporin n=2 Tax=Mesocestoides corti TaxID=53468 RepID=A0A0R3U9B5_MESCO|nr:unnamed protein product [Mesocestoides corti]